jgi:hypothetical protein
LIVEAGGTKVGFEVLTAASMKMAVFWVVAPCSLMMEAASTSETSVNFYQTTRRYNPEESYLQVGHIVTIGLLRVNCLTCGHAWRFNQNPARKNPEGTRPE